MPEDINYGGKAENISGKTRRKYTKNLTNKKQEKLIIIQNDEEKQNIKAPKNEKIENDTSEQKEDKRIKIPAVELSAIVTLEKVENGKKLADAAPIKTISKRGKAAKDYHRAQENFKESDGEKIKENGNAFKNGTKNLISFTVQKIGLPLPPHNKKENKKQNIKCKLCLQVFEVFKKHGNYKLFKKFAKIEKQIFANHYDKLSKMADDITKTFNEYFSVLYADANNYQKLFALLAYFESIYKEYEMKKFIYDSKNVLEIKKKMNKLQRVVKSNRLGNQVVVNNFDNGNNNMQSFGSMIDENDAFENYQNNKIIRPKHNGAIHNGNYIYTGVNRDKKISNKFKLELLSNIKSLNTAQIRGMIRVLQNDTNDFNNSINNTVDSNITSLELDINKLSPHKIKELDKYVRKCLLENKCSNSQTFKFPNTNSNSDYEYNNYPCDNYMVGHNIDNSNYSKNNNHFTNKISEFNGNGGYGNNQSNDNNNTNVKNFLGKKIAKKDFFDSVSSQKQPKERDSNSNIFIGEDDDIENENPGYYIDENENSYNYFLSNTNKSTADKFLTKKMVEIGDITLNNSNNNLKSNYLIQTSITNPETPVSHLNKISEFPKYEKKNSLCLDSESDSDMDSDDSSDEESLSDLKLENFKM